MVMTRVLLSAIPGGTAAKRGSPSFLLSRYLEWQGVGGSGQEKAPGVSSDGTAGRCTGARAALARYSLGDVVADLAGGAAGPAGQPLDDVVGDGLLDLGRLVGQAEVVEHHGDGQDGRGGVGLALPGDVGGAAVDRLEHARRGALGVDVAARGQADAAGDGGAEVGDDVAEEVVGDDHVEPLGLA